MSQAFSILLVDDDAFILEVLRIQLERILPDNVVVERASSGEEGLEMVAELTQSKETPLALIVSDYLMPGILGSDFLIQAHAINPRAKKMMLTGQAEVENVLKVLHHMELYRYVGKPWEPEMINLAVLDAVQQFTEDYSLRHRL
ncbi:MAG: response regulator [Bacteroidetes bacterium]|nr:response regulator [Bacteroidota bacterium]